MPAFTDKLQAQLTSILASFAQPVTLVTFTRPDDTDTRELVEELAALSGGRVAAELHDLERDRDEAQRYGIDKAPAIAVLGDASGRRDFGIRFFGVPRGYEFGALVEDMRMASAAEAGLSEQTRAVLAHLDAPLHIQVFVTPTCPYCPRAALLAHKLAIASDRITADAVDASEFPELAERYDVYGVPRTVINDTLHIEGAVAEAELMAELASFAEERL